MKILIRLGVIGFALLAIAFYFTVDRLAGTAIERGATYALGVDTQVGFVRVSFLAGTLRVSSLDIENPPGFDADDLLTVGSIRLEVPPARLRDPVVRVPTLALDDVTVSLEKAERRTNYGIVLDNLKRFESQGTPAPRDAETPATRFIVEEIVIRNIEAHIEKFERLGDLAALDVTIPEVRLRDVGAHNAEGVAMAELTDVVVKAVFTAIAKNGGALPAAVVGELASGLGSLASVPIDVVGGAAGSITDALPEGVREGARKLGDGAQDAGRKALDGLGRVFRRDGDD